MTRRDLVLYPRAGDSVDSIHSVWILKIGAESKPFDLMSEDDLNSENPIFFEEACETFDMGFFADNAWRKVEAGMQDFWVGLHNFALNRAEL